MFQWSYKIYCGTYCVTQIESVPSNSVRSNRLPVHEYVTVSALAIPARHIVIPKQRATAIDLKPRMFATAGIARDLCKKGFIGNLPGQMAKESIRTVVATV